MKRKDWSSEEIYRKRTRANYAQHLCKKSGILGTISIFTYRKLKANKMSVSKRKDFEPLVCNIRSQLKTKLKIAAAKKRQSMTEYLTTVLEEKLIQTKN